MVILVFGKGLWFGNRMDPSLINSNQCRSYGIALYYEPKYEHKSLGLYMEKYLIPMGMKETT